VQTIVSEFHGGKIYAKNNPEGGACFTIELPFKNPTPK
jgi:signal transduction histidine kinase